ncbi:MAG: phosphoglycerate kinase [Candidatus Eremiobacteraeota bacterium]|nr:phosphoglycerate kinase [Candidatus Eremiobacteraeota bacterium]MBC5826389.1 phosphoglycerate kinase [Candidatus Eremiobacteraeota bacterium]
MAEPSLAELDLKGKRVLVREDLNVPLDGLNISDATRIDAAVPTLRDLSQRGAKVIVMSHLGRPGGTVVESLRMLPVARALSAALGRDVRTVSDCVGESARRAVAQMADGDVLMLENLRFHKEEENDDDGFSRELAAMADVYVNDAFGAAHRAHASTAGVAKYLPAYMGPLLARELEVLDRLLQHPARPFIAVLGGAKIADKIGVIERLLSICDAVLVGGGMANTLLAAEGFEVGRSLRDSDLEPARSVMKDIEERATAVDVRLPKDAVIAKEIRAGVETQVVDIDQIPPDEMMLDIGPATAMDYRGVILRAKTVLWNGPMGLFENDEFAAGTEAVGQAIVDSGAMSFVGGGDTAAAAHKLGFADKMTHISTGGGATLEYIEGKQLPGVAALRSGSSP